MEATTVFLADEHAWYPVHEEANLPEVPIHRIQCRYFENAFEVHLPGCRLGANMCLYWVPGNTAIYVAADVVLIEGPRPSALPAVYLAWSDPPLLFVAEVASSSTKRRDVSEKLAIYERNLRAEEYLFVDNARRRARLWRMIEGSYHLVRPNPNGRLWSAQLQAFLGFDAAGLLRMSAKDGALLPTMEEQAERTRAEARRADVETARAAEEARRRARAEERASVESQRREEAERRLAAALAELEKHRGGAA